MTQLLKTDKRNRLQELIERSKQQRTVTVIHPIIGRPRGPCRCGATLFSVTRTGDVICWGCNYDLAHALGISFAFGLVALDPQRPDDTIAMDLRDPRFLELDQPQRWCLVRSDGRHWITALPSNPIPSGMTDIEWWPD